jgi:predicted DNA-binding protein (MmcQ/YjbR family)
MPTARQIESRLRELALAFPETREDFPWGERVIKVRDKIFLFVRAEKTGLSITVKLKSLHAAALRMRNVKRTGYGLGKHGWVSAKFQQSHPASLELLRQWVNESFRLVAPKKLVDALKELDGSDDDGEILRPLIRSRRKRR